MEALFIQNAMLVDPRGVGTRRAGIFVRNGVIERILTDGRGRAFLQMPDTTRVIDASRWFAFPGLIDPHVHFRDPGYTDKEDICTGAAAAKHGGFTCVIMMGNTNPPMDTPSRIEQALDKGRKTGIRVCCCGNVTFGMKGQELTDFEALKRAGAVLLSDDGLPVRDGQVMERACGAAAPLNLILSLHEEDPAFIRESGINSGAVAESLGLAGADRRAEMKMVARDIEIVRRTGAEITVQHVSAAESVDQIRRARAEGLPVHAEATPHHFTLTEDAVRQFGANAKMNPPLRTEADRQAIIRGLADGTIDMIATDHAPHTEKEKKAGLLQAPSGIIGLETALSLVYRELVRPGYLSWELAVRRLTEAYDIYGLPGGRIKEGEPADITLFSAEESWTAGAFYSRAENTPFINETLPGVVKLTICGGRIVYEDGKGVNCE